MLLCIAIRSINNLNRCMCIWPDFQSYNVWILLKTVMKYLIDQFAKQYRCYITVRLGCNGNYMHTTLMHLFKLFIDRIDIHNDTYKIEFNFFTRNVGELTEWWSRSTCNLKAVQSWGFESCRGQDICNVHLFRVPLSWTGSVQMISSMTFIPGDRCIEREKDIFKFGREVKR